MQSGRNHALMIFAAGFGTRMGDLTRNRPKPLIPVAGRALLDHALDIGQEARAAPVVVNAHYLADQIAGHLSARPDVLLSREEDEILDTGGGLKAALPLLGAAPLFTLNSDAVWQGPNPLSRLAAHWDPGRMDALLLLGRPGDCLGRSGGGDFTLDAASGRIARGKGDPAALVYLGAEIIHPALVQGISERVFSLNRAWDQAIAAGRAYGLVYPGRWCDVGHPAGIAEAEAMLASPVPGHG